ncbi:MAG: anthranilate synthase amidotransferase component TrpG [Idiomarinaceae bacterium HL-53]|nr:MAG: anthranilate synthase amidotransferase component TrpG [Idiomarinaceae bacterium HL-53]CUS48631.1 anthranilate synthase component 2 [Idiomarinaceae bacterium HL-53]
MNQLAPNTQILMLDNQDSFTYNLVDELAQIGCQLEVYRNTTALDTVINELSRLEQLGPVLIVLSPGPGHPREAGILMPLLAHVVGKYPVLGICLGFQAIVEYFGGEVARCYETVHGKTAYIDTTTHPIFEDTNNSSMVARYHSLMATAVPSELEIIAKTRDIPMAVSHQAMPCVGFQFHPESIMTTDGSLLLQRTVAYLTRTQHIQE